MPKMKVRKKQQVMVKIKGKRTKSQDSVDTVESQSELTQQALDTIFNKVDPADIDTIDFSKEHGPSGQDDYHRIMKCSESTTIDIKHLRSKDELDKEKMQ